MRNISAPEPFITFSYYWMISAALQRRVWLQDENKPLFPNQYVVLVGKPALGKGMAMGPVIEALRHHRKTARVVPEVPQKLIAPEVAEEQAKLIEMQRELQSALQAMTEKSVLVSRSNRIPYLFPCAPDDITYEDLVNQMANSTSRINVDKISKLAPNGTYGHSSMAIALAEMATLFKKHSDKCLKMLLKVFDCDDYEYSTLGRGLDLVRRPCLSLIAGTTPGQIREMMDHNIIDDGWSSRCIFVFCRDKRFNTFGVKDYEADQLRDKETILAHLKQLSRVFGRLKYSAEAYAYLADYFENARGIINKDPKLEPYYGRKNIHVPKLAAAIHFSEVDIIERDGKLLYNDTMSLAEAKRAVSLLESIEVDMHCALTIRKENPLANVSDRLLEILSERGPLSRSDMMKLSWDILPAGEDSFDMAIRYLMGHGKVEQFSLVKNSPKLYRKV